jgi:hypothetical protein
VIEGLSLPSGLGGGGDSPLNDGPSLCGYREEIRSRLGESTENADFWSEAQVDRAINEALRRFSREQRWSWLYTSVEGVVIPADTKTLALQPEVAAHRHLNLSAVRAGDSNIMPFRRVAPNVGFDLRRTYERTGVSINGYTTWYYLESAALGPGDGSTPGPMTWVIRLVPPPDVEYVLDYQFIRNPAKLVACGDIGDIPGVYSEAVNSWATGTLWLAELNGGSKAQEQFNIYASVLEQAQNDETGSIPDTIVRWGGAEPQLEQPLTGDLWSRLHMPGTLGP